MKVRSLSELKTLRKAIAEQAARLAAERAAAEAAETRRLLGQLTSREAEVLELIAKGLTTRQIAEALSLSPRTVESHRAAIGVKTGTTSAAELTRFWLEGREAP